jgi:hypothetical protein
MQPKERRETGEQDLFCSRLDYSRTTDGHVIGAHLASRVGHLIDEMIAASRAGIAILANIRPGL